MKFDIIAFMLSCLVILIYYLYLGRQNRSVPGSSVHSLNASVRQRWVKMIMSGDNKQVLAVQTLRNSVLATNFMASTSILLIIGTLNISEKIGTWALEWRPFGLTQAFSTELWQLKLFILLLIFSIAFYCFSMAIRFYNHVGYIINLSDNQSTEHDLFKQTCTYLNRAGSYYTFGIRSFFFSLPIILWFFGPYFLILATIGLVGGLVMLDKVPT